MKLTPWYPPHIKPVRVGVYETLRKGCFQYWNGEWWGYWSSTKKDAFGLNGGKSVFQHPRWRGLAHPPK